MSQVDPSMLLLQMQTSSAKKRTPETQPEKTATQPGKIPTSPWRELLGEQHLPTTSRQEPDPQSAPPSPTNLDDGEIGSDSSSNPQTVTTPKIDTTVETSGHETVVEKFVPMHLHATGHLAYQANGRGIEGVASFSSRATSRQAESVNAPNDENATRGPQRADASFNGTNVSTPGNAQAMSAPRKALEILRGVIESSGTAQRNADSEWLARRFQILERDGQLHVRIRDYQLDTETQNRITESLLAHAHANGRQVSRVLINGRLMWADGNLLIDEHRGERHAD